MLDSSDELTDTISIAVGAGRILTDYFGSDRMDTRTKGERDVVTAADLAAESFIREALSNRFPLDGMVGEEGTDTKAQSGRLWYVDPLDGTLNYSRGLPVWCVSMALYRDAEPLLAVIHDPIRHETFTAAAGRGAWCNGFALRTSTVQDPVDAFVHVTVDFHDGSLHAGLDDIARIAPAVLRTRNIGSAALSLAYVAAGRFDAVLHRFAHAWDYAAGVLLITEAGGYVTGMDGLPYTPEEHTMLAAGTRTLHARVSHLLRSTGMHG